MSGLKKAGKALKEAYQDALPGKGNTTKALTVTHTTHEGETADDGDVVVHISGPEADGLAAYAKLFPGDAFGLAHPEGVIVHTATVDRKTDGAETARTHHITITHYVTSY